MGTSTSLTAWSHTTLSLTGFGRAGSGTALKTTHRKGQTACRFTNCAHFSESAKGESPEKVFDALPEHLRNAARH